MKNLIQKLIVVFPIALFACSSGNVTSKKTETQSVSNIAVNGKLFTSLYQQRAAEYRALCFQAFNLAKIRIDQYQPLTNKTLAIVTDIDETILDNSPYEVMRTLDGKDYDQESWYRWTELAAADTVPGGCAFLKYAANKKIEVFYITNRDEKEKSSTLRNLQHFGFPNADNEHLVMKSSGSSKEVRRKAVADTREIVLLLGDNLADFSSLFDKKTSMERNQNVNMSSMDFGNRFIVIPNPVYGDWESSLYNYNYKLTTAQKDSVVRSNVKRIENW